MDFKKFYKWVAQENEIVYAKIFMGMPAWSPAKFINEGLKKYYESIGYSVVTKPLKKIMLLDGTYKNKCNFDVEIHDEVVNDLPRLDMVYLVSGDSDFMRTKERVLKNEKHIKFIAYKNNCSWEIMRSWHLFLEEIKDEIKRD